MGRTFSWSAGLALALTLSKTSRAVTSPSLSSSTSWSGRALAAAPGGDEVVQTGNVGGGNLIVFGREDDDQALVRPLVARRVRDVLLVDPVVGVALELKMPPEIDISTHSDGESDGK